MKDKVKAVVEKIREESDFWDKKGLINIGMTKEEYVAQAIVDWHEGEIKPIRDVYEKGKGLSNKTRWEEIMWQAIKKLGEKHEN